MPESTVNLAHRSERLGEAVAELCAETFEEPTVRSEFLRTIHEVFEGESSLLWREVDSWPPKVDSAISTPDLNVARDQELLRTLAKIAFQTAAVEQSSTFSAEHAQDLPPRFEAVSVPLVTPTYVYVAVVLVNAAAVDSGDSSRARRGELTSLAENVAASFRTQMVRELSAPSQLNDSGGMPDSRSDRGALPQSLESASKPKQPDLVANELAEGSLGSTVAELEGAHDLAASAARSSSTIDPTFLFALHRSLQLDRVAMTLVNDGRVVTHFDRVGLALKRGAKTYLHAISGVDQVNRRSDEMRSLLKLSRVCIDTGQLLEFSDAAALDERTQDLFAEHAQFSNARQVRLLPIYRSDDPRSYRNDPKQPPREKDRLRPIGCLTFELFATPSSKPADGQQLQILAEHASVAVSNAIAVKRLPALGLWQALGNLTEWLYGRKLLKVCLIAVAVTAAITALAFVPFPYRVTADGMLMPLVQQRVFAPTDGDVERVVVEGGTEVSEGDLLVQLRDDELATNVVTTKSQINEERQSIHTLRTQISETVREADTDNELRLRGELSAAIIRLQGLEENLQVYEDRTKRLALRSPIDGVVATFQTEQLLGGRPLVRGELMLEVMDTASRWQLEVQIPDYRMGRIAEALEAAGNDGIPVEFILLTDSTKTFNGTLTASNLGTRANANEEGEMIVTAMIDLANDPELQQRVGAEVSAKLFCGQSNLADVLFSDLVDFVRRHLWL